MQIAVIYSKPSRKIRATAYGATDEDSAIIADKVVMGVESLGHKARLIEINEDHIEEIGSIRADVIFNLIEWCGSDIHLAKIAFGYLRRLKIPVTGSAEAEFVLTGDKIALKNFLLKNHIPTPGKTKFPMIVKPSLEHCSMGLGYDSIAQNTRELEEIIKKKEGEFGQPMLYEEFIVGRELLVYLIVIEGVIKVLPIEELLFSNGNPLAFQTYAAKWEIDHPDYKTSRVEVANLTDSERQIIEKVSIDAFEKLGLRGYARFDVRFADNIPYFLECNANPSVYDGEDDEINPESEVIPGIKFCDYLEAIVLAARIL